jgi:hypothetical protein
MATAAASVYHDHNRRSISIERNHQPGTINPQEERQVSFHLKQLGKHLDIGENQSSVDYLRQPFDEDGKAIWADPLLNLQDKFSEIHEIPNPLKNKNPANVLMEVGFTSWPFTGVTMPLRS